MSQYSEEDYNSNDGMLTAVWGPALWHTLHTISFNYPPNPTREQKSQYRTFVLSLQHTLPCGACRRNLKSNLEKVPLSDYCLKNRQNFSRWMYRLHDQVNKMLDKPPSPSYEEVRELYEGFRARCVKKKVEKVESGCTKPMPGNTKSKCVLYIVPRDTDCKTLNVDQRCLPDYSRTM
jgi:hypothetical protein